MVRIEPWGGLVRTSTSVGHRQRTKRAPARSAICSNGRSVSISVAPGVKVPPEVYKELKKGVVELGNDIAKLRKDLANKPALLELGFEQLIWGVSLKPGKPFCEVGDPHKLEAHLILDQGLRRVMGFPHVAPAEEDMLPEVDPNPLNAGEPIQE